MQVIDNSGQIVKPKRLDSILSVRLNPDELRFLGWHAEQRGISKSELLRRMVADLPAYYIGRSVS